MRWAGGRAGQAQQRAGPASQSGGRAGPQGRGYRAAAAGSAALAAPPRRMIKLLLVSAGATLFGIITAAILLNLAMGCGAGGYCTWPWR